MKKYLTLLAVLAIQACTPTGEHYTEHNDPHQGTIVVYRGFSSAIESFSIDVNGKLACDLQESGFFVVRAKGPTTISASKWSMPGTSRITIDAQPGKTQYVRIEMSTSKRLSGILGLPGLLLAEGVSDKGGPYELEVKDAVIAKRELAPFHEDCK